MSEPQYQSGSKPAAPLSFTLGLDKAVYPPAPDAQSPTKMTAYLTLRSTVTPPVVLEFFSLQEYDLIITNGAGQQVYQWSAGRAFPDIASNVPVDGEKSWTIDVTLEDAQKTPLPPGPYVARAYLMNRTSDPGVTDPQAFAGKYGGSIGFSISS